MVGRKQGQSPLRDRLLSNSPDPIKSNILRESGMGWNSPPSNKPSSPSATSPLRIAKRESPQRQPFVARRSSSSYKHLRNNNLVSKSPFKSQIPTPSHQTPVSFPSPRRVSGEKRSRSASMHEQAEDENERPFSLKRERKQSKGLQGLIQMEPVTKSPFRRPPTPDNDVAPPPQPLARLPIPSFAPPTSDIPTPTSNGTSPTRSSLVSKRMHGPRLSGKNKQTKTVQFNERCDVVEFEYEEESEAFETDSGGEEDNDDPFFQPSQSDNYEHPTALDDSYESIELGNAEVPIDLDPDTSITGLVDEIFIANSSNAVPVSPLTSTPPASDAETESPISNGHTNHVGPYHDHQRRSAHHTHSPSQYPVPQSPATPPRHSPVPSALGSPPLGRSTHSERMKAARTEDKNTYEEDVGFLPPSPSPNKRSSSDRSGQVSRFEVDIRGTEHKIWTQEHNSGSFARDHPDPLHDECSVDAAHFSEVNLSGLEAELGIPSTAIVTHSRTEHTETPVHPNDRSKIVPDASFEDNDNDYLKDDRAYARPSSSPATARVAVREPTASPAPIPSVNGSSQTLSSGGGGRMRINREEVKKRLLRERNRESTSPSPRGKVEEGGERDQETEQRYGQRQRDEELGKEDSLEKDGDAVSSITDLSAEMAVIETIERRPIAGGGRGTCTVKLEVGKGQEADEKDTEFGLLQASQSRLRVDFGSKFGLGGLGIRGIGTIGSSSPKARQGEAVVKMGAGLEVKMDGRGASGSNTETTEMKMGDLDVDVEMKSALDRLMDDVAGTRADDSIVTEGESYDADRDQSRGKQASSLISKPMVRAATDSELLLGSGGGNGFVSRTVSGSSIAPPVPPKDNIRSREEMILEKRREARMREEGESMGYCTPPRTGRRLSVGRPSRRRSMSTGDAETLGGGARRRAAAMRGEGSLLDVVPGAEEHDPLGDSIEKELRKLEGPHKTSYYVRQHAGMIYASSDADKVSHMAGPGDVNAGKAWRTVRRPSDMNEYSKQIKEYRAQEKSGKAYGKVFVKVLTVRGIHLPLPQEPTAVSCTLNNGIHFVTTPDCQLGRDCRIEQEFELIEHSKLEFTLTLKIRRDPHIIAQFKSLSPAPVAAPPPVAPSSSKSGVRSFFSSSPKKPKEKDKANSRPASQPAPRLTECLARYLKPDGMLARAFVSFKDIASRCDAKLFETSYPLIGQRVELGNKLSTLQIGEIVLQMFRLPPLPGIAPALLPQSLEECHRGLRHVNWHKVTYFEGTLTQSGGDCSTWRRRQLRVIGSNLVAFNDVTKKATASIDLKKAIAVEDDRESRNNTLSPASGMTTQSGRYADEYDGLFGVERSFRLLFPHGEEILFFADTDDEKDKWLDVLRALVGHIPPHPLWAELLWQQQDELAKRTRAEPGSSKPGSNPTSYASQKGTKSRQR